MPDWVVQTSLESSAGLEYGHPPEIALLLSNRSSRDSDGVGCPQKNRHLRQKNRADGD